MIIEKLAVLMKERLTKAKRKEKRTPGRNYIILVGLIFLFVMYQSCFKLEIIGSDSRYFLIFILAPTLFGLLILGYFKRNFLRFRFKEGKGIIQKGFLFFLYFIQGFLFAFLSVGLFANIIWDNLNKKTADLNPAELIYCSITDFSSETSKSGPGIYFSFRGKNERLSVDHATYGKYYNTKPVDLNLQLTIRKGIWNCYIVDEWKIINNR